MISVRSAFIVEKEFLLHTFVLMYESAPKGKLS